jgi:hypothetical protein
LKFVLCIFCKNLLPVLLTFVPYCIDYLADFLSIFSKFVSSVCRSQLTFSAGCLTFLDLRGAAFETCTLYFL